MYRQLIYERHVLVIARKSSKDNELTYARMTTENLTRQQCSRTFSEFANFFL